MCVWRTARNKVCKPRIKAKDGDTESMWPVSSHGKSAKLKSMYVWRDKREVEKWGGKGVSGHFKQSMKQAWGKLGWAN